MATLPAILAAPLGGGTAFVLGDYAGNIINDAAVECGLVARDDPFDGQDANFVQLCTLLKRVGRLLAREHEWTHLNKEYTFVTVQGTSEYDLPPDFRGLVNQTEQNRTTRFPVSGPVSSQAWQRLQALSAGLVFNVLFRIQNQKIQLYPTTATPGGYTIAFEYNSSYWVQSQTGATVYKDAPTSKLDRILFDPVLAVLALKVAFLRNKGFDSSAAQDDFAEALGRVRDEDSAAPILNAGHNTAGAPHMLDESNVPITGFGVT